MRTPDISISRSSDVSSVHKRPLRRYCLEKCSVFNLSSQRSIRNNEYRSPTYHSIIIKLETEEIQTSHRKRLDSSKQKEMDASMSIQTKQ